MIELIIKLIIIIPADYYCTSCTHVSEINKLSKSLTYNTIKIRISADAHCKAS